MGSSWWGTWKWVGEMGKGGGKEVEDDAIGIMEEGERKVCSLVTASSPNSDGQ